MKMIVNTARVIVGILFIFSGLIKANDPHGLAYKMQEFFDVWSRDASLTTFMQWLSGYALPFAILMITLEIIVGVGILLGSWKKFFTSLLVILIVFFAFLTGYAVFSGKIATCGCFGDCIPLTSVQSFVKDIVLLVLVLVLFFGQKHIHPVFSRGVNTLLLILSTAGVLFYQGYVMKHLPTVDCLPFKKGGNILELRKLPADAVPDKKEYRFVYEKDGVKKTFGMNDLPDSTWQFVSREDVVIEKGKNNEPPIKDYYLSTFEGNDSTEAILATPGLYYFFYVKDIAGSTQWLEAFKELHDFAGKHHRAIYIVTPEKEMAQEFFNTRHHFNVPVLSLDATAFKTAARTNPELYLMNGPVISDKWGSADFRKAAKE